MLNIILQNLTQTYTPEQAKFIRSFQHPWMMVRILLQSLLRVLAEVRFSFFRFLLTLSIRQWP